MFTMKYVSAEGQPLIMINSDTADPGALAYGDSEGLPAALAADITPAPAGGSRPVIVFMM
jgi:hypothetical protein